MQLKKMWGIVLGLSILINAQAGVIYSASCSQARHLQLGMSLTQCQQNNNTDLSTLLLDSANDPQFVNHVCSALPRSSRKICKNQYATFSYYTEASGLAYIIGLGSNTPAEDCNMFNEDKSMLHAILNSYLRTC